ncbi:threonine aspartase 1 isoform X1 [Neodiprion virginianus]|uniref:threonine aspartase 1 isoform X1 n=1 Tax=Neodiprion virginianus TaxID=2961670 RepID=UPI001EE6DB22|nr:threonine aspartase 1 isoform X1 [Neodiprion virginianus]
MAANSIADHMDMDSSRNGLIAVHVGAGQHSLTLKEKYEKLCCVACKKAASILKSGGNVLDAVVEATIILENSPLTNAGYGSNLTIEGKVECDASVMDGSTLQFGAVGAVGGIKNPVAAAKLLCNQQSGNLTHGRIFPSFLVGDGAQLWGKEKGLQTTSVEDLISVKALKIYKHYKRKVLSCENVQKQITKKMDTVGAICVDTDGNVASACSSGGIILKHPGRVGQAAVWGCGVWARSARGSPDCSVATSTSGCGEHLISATLARSIAEGILSSNCPTTALHSVMKNDFIESPFLTGLDQKLGGTIAIKYSPQQFVGDLLWSHSTKSMIIGYMNTRELKPKSRMSVLTSPEVGRKAVVEGIGFRI